MQKLIRLAVICCIFIGGPALAEMPVEIISKTPDVVGQRLVFALKEGIRSSSSLGLSFDQSKPRIQVVVATIDESTSSPGHKTVYAVSILLKNPDELFPFYLDQSVGYCGSERVQECADGVVADVSEIWDTMLKLYQKLSER